MRFVFTTRFFVLLAFGLALLSVGWISRGALYVTLIYDFALIVMAAVDYQLSEKPAAFRIEREMEERNVYNLTFREFTVLHHIAAGETDKVIAAALGISPLTVHKHVASILAKMGASSRTEAGVRALREGLLEPAQRA